MLPIQYKSLNTTPPALVDNTTATAAEIDTAGYSYGVITVSFGVCDIGVSSLKLQMSDTSGSGFADVPGTTFGTDAAVDASTSALPSASSDSGQFTWEVDLLGKKRYFEVVCTVGDGSAGNYMHIHTLLLNPENGPDPDSITDKGLTGLLRA